MDIELTYSKGLLREIGGVAITYGPREGADTTPRAMGSWTLEYQRFSSTLKAVGGIEVTYRRWSSLPLTVGQWRCEQRKSRLEHIGPYELQYDRSGRTCAVGPFQIDYDQGGSRPARARLQSNDQALPDELLLVLFLVLFWQQQAWDAYYQANR
ncbi:hypothetical protein GCM10010103_66790 [Streptomyces paradoxus]|uniref:Uncharacterized protein n=1 Tax=Streptomyces paradoxus TaxID=66375 RepID=A0A7W9TJF5_9ACTN|nr:hypothetical protein [Streptomyces paradoxus]MBB6081834.1 hypothetical protein [Streptomyces paradoxus]